MADIDVNQFNQAVSDMQTATSNMNALAGRVEADAHTRVETAINDLDLRNTITIHWDFTNEGGNASDATGDGSKARPFKTQKGVKTAFKAGRQHNIVLMGGLAKITEPDHNYFPSTGAYTLVSEVPWHVDNDTAKPLNHAAMPELQASAGCCLGAGTGYHASCTISLQNIVPHIRNKVAPLGADNWANGFFFIAGGANLVTHYKMRAFADAKDIAGQSLVTLTHLGGAAFNGLFENMNGNFVTGVGAGQNIIETLGNPGIRCNRTNG